MGVPYSPNGRRATVIRTTFVSLIAASHIHTEDMAYTEEKSGNSGGSDPPREPGPPR
jgi:hypothetical protein